MNWNEHAPIPKSRDIDWVVAFDPGGVHVGYATWRRYTTAESGDVTAEEITPGDTDRTLRQFILGRWADDARSLGVVVIEEFRLYGGQTLRTQVNSAMETSQLIGVIKSCCALAGVPWIEQGASIKKPTAAMLAARGVKLRSAEAGAGGHASDAELHLKHFMMRRGIC